MYLVLFNSFLGGDFKDWRQEIWESFLGGYLKFKEDFFNDK